MYTTTSIIAWALVTLAIGFATGWLVGLFHLKKKAEAESAAVDDGWQSVEQRFQAQIDELKSKLDEQAVSQLGAQSEAPKKI
ncbi:hypothetical protein CG435_10850 [Pantoea ananatis]|uniref:hypothetical protein n=1 Tax=Pantoea ananas TaxID=553 RepID=UPI000CF3EAD3|nr:hypothetical protein [Pantoea ananatis]MDF7789597.1 hypothetical protein [Pantoea ananatis]PQK99595.1 hypothetical protein CG435_10850 [Pantoea ananatis]